MATVAAALACLAAAAPGCGASAAPEAPPAPRAFAIAYERGGGLYPASRKLTIGPGRHTVASTEASGGPYNRTVRFRVPAKRIRGIQRALARANFAAIESDPSAGCADCYLYSIRYRGHEVTLPETDVSARLRRAIEQLEAVIAAHVKGRA